MAATTYNWTLNGTGNWSTAADWNPNTATPGNKTTDGANITIGTVVFDKTPNNNAIANLNVNGGNLVFSMSTPRRSTSAARLTSMPARSR